MKPGNRHICEMVPNHSKRKALIDERNGNVHNYIRSAFLLICRKAFFILKRKAPCRLDRRWKTNHKGVFCLFGKSETTREPGACSWMKLKRKALDSFLK